MRSAVGIGLGLQKLAANYIAGFTILLDKSIRLGDIITVDGRYGVVARVTSRYVVVRSLDGVEAIVPNETLVITTVLNHSSTTRELRISVQVQIAYDADVDRALALMVEAARVETRVIHEGGNAPAAFLLGFGDSGLNLELGLWLKDPENGQLALKQHAEPAHFRGFQGQWHRNSLSAARYPLGGRRCHRPSVLGLTLDTPPAPIA